MSFNRIVLYLFSLVLLIGLGFAHITHAATGLSVQPVKILYTLTPGQTVSGKILLSNQSDEAVQVETKVEDFIPTAGSDGIQFVGRAPGVTTVRDWITLGDNKTFTFEKSAQMEVPYTITVPVNAEPGSHFGVAFFKATKVSELTSALKIGTQVGVLVFITVPGNHLQKGNILDFTAPRFQQYGPIPFIMKFENTGTVHFEPKGEISIKNMFGKEIAQVPIGGEVILPTGIKDLKFNWNVTGFLLGYYRAVANVRDGDGTLLSSKEVGFYVIPVWYILAFLIGLIIIFFIIRFLKKRLKISISLN